MTNINLKKTLEIWQDFIEVRILNTNSGTISGYFNDPELLEKAIRCYDGKYNIFFTMNELDCNIISRSKNHFTKWSKNTTNDKEIIRRNWILIDLDPVRPSGVSSTDEELHFAKELSLTIKNFLKEESFPEPIYAMSGNGYHILLPVDMENNTTSTKLVKNFLYFMDKTFSNEKVKVDTTTYNAARIVKLYGTVACKGDHTADRPHRKSYIIEVPKKIIPVEQQLLEKFSIMNNVNPIKETEKTSKPLSVKDYLQSHGIEISHEKPYEDGATCYVLKKCPWNDEHTDKSAYVIEFPNGKIVAGCHHDSCSGENWKTLQKKYPKESIKTASHSISKKTEKDGMSTSDIILHDIMEAGHKFYHDKSDVAYVSFEDNGYTKHLVVQDSSYMQQIRYMYLKKYGKSLHKDCIQQILDTLEVKALHEGNLIQPAIRCKYLQGKIYYYLADDEQTVICIDEDGLHFMKQSPIPFIKRKTMGEQVVPLESKTSFRKLASKHWKFASKTDRMLHHILLISRYISDVPLPIIYYHGDRGSAKTTSMRMDKMLIDPSPIDVKALPKNINDVIASLSTQYMICYDNIDRIAPYLSDIMCITTTNGYYSKKKLYSNNDEYPIMLNARLSFTGITNISNKADLIDRMVCLKLKRIDAKKRKTLDEVMDAFKKDVPYLLYEIMKILAKSIQVYKELDLHSLPRMADFAKWGYAIAEVMGYGGETFLEAYEKNQNGLLESMVEEDSLANEIGRAHV